MILTAENYFSKEADLQYMSVSQFKSFQKCEAEALYLLENDISGDKNISFLQGHYFEAIVTGNKDLFEAQNYKELISSRGPTAGELKSDFKKVLVAAERFLEQDFFKNIIQRCDKQIILTGEIEGVKTKCAIDLLDKNILDFYDIKCMADFKDAWNSEEKHYVPWYYNYGYVLQLAVYREIIKQNFGKVNENGLLAATKENIPDIDALTFSDELLNIELENFKNNVKRYDDIKKHLIEPIYCGKCEYCKSIKKITQFKEVK